MLRELSIKNFAIIDDLKICFSEGLTVLSGETGAGKSIIINAVNLLLGSRATSTLIRTGAETAELEALFDIAPGSRAAVLMNEYGLDSSDGLIIRRIISRSDRHKIYINGRLSTIQALESVTENLASISGQHVHQGLLKDEQHLLILDRFGDLMPLRNEAGNLFNEIVPMAKQLNELNCLKIKQAEQIDFLSFQRREIAEASVKPGEDAELESLRRRLKNAESLQESVGKSIEELYGEPGSVIERLGIISKNLAKAGRIDPVLSAKAEAVSAAAYNIEDINNELRAYLLKIETDGKELESVEARLDLLNRLKRKYGGSIDSVLEKLESIGKELAGIENISERIAETEKRLGILHNNLVSVAKELSAKRSESAKQLALKVEKELATLKMPKTKFKVSVEPVAAQEGTDPFLVVDGKVAGETGIDRAEFMIAPNIGEELKPLSAIASGGELSRVVLALKALLAGSGSVETVVFDEVDAGIGGGVAEVVGRKMASLAGHHQIICITHLPQIARFGDNHFRISKHVEGGRTKTVISPLGPKERIEELARMLGGEEITRATIVHAREMLEGR